MNGLDRTMTFLEGGKVDHPPFHPIIMQWAAKYGDVAYGDFCLDYRQKAQAAFKCADELKVDWMTVMSDPYVEAEAFGLSVEYPENNLPLERGGHLPDIEAVESLKPYRYEEHRRCVNRVREIEEMSRLSKDHFILGWVEGPIAEYSDIRGLADSSMDFYDDPDAVSHALDVIIESALPFIKAQVEAGAHGIGIGDAFCSQIGPSLYEEFAFEREKILVDYIHSLGAKAKLHVCGNTSPILEKMILTGADIIDVDHLVESMEPFAKFLSPTQVFSGRVDPVSIIQDSSPATIKESVQRCYTEANKRCITSAGCEIPLDTSLENFMAFQESCYDLN